MLPMSAVPYPPESTGCVSFGGTCNGVPCGLVRLHWYSWGTGPPLVLLQGRNAHTMCGDIDSVLAHEVAARGFRVIILDNRDAGRGTKFPSCAPVTLATIVLSKMTNRRAKHAGYALEDMAHDVISVLNVLGVDTFHVGGFSMGGMIAQLLAIAHPHRVLSLTVISSSPSRPGVHGCPGTTYLNALAITRTDVPLERYESEPRFQRWWAAFERGARLVDGISFDADALILKGKLRLRLQFDADAAGPLRQLHAVFATRNRLAALAHLTIPALVVHGAIDRVLPVANAVTAHYTIPDSVLLMVPGMGHALSSVFHRRVVDAMVAVCNRGSHGAMPVRALHVPTNIKVEQCHAPMCHALQLDSHV